jgi:hypothetical protein
VTQPGTTEEGGDGSKTRKGHIKDPQWAVGNGGNSLVETKKKKKKKNPKQRQKCLEKK